MSAGGLMSLNTALHILASIHTKDDYEAGFTVMAGAGPDYPLTEFGTDDYIEAWETVRDYLHLPTEPRQGDRTSDSPDSTVA